MGKLAFAPATPEVLRLVHHLDTTHALFGDAFHGVFRWESLWATPTSFRPPDDLRDTFPLLA